MDEWLKECPSLEWGGAIFYLFGKNENGTFSGDYTVHGIVLIRSISGVVPLPFLFHF
jgi:hypothetical protein